MHETDPKVNILLVDDKPDKLLSMEAVLEGLGENLVRAQSGKEALRHLLKMDFAVILLDVNMPDMDGFETAAFIRRRKNSEHIPIIFITALGDEMHVNRGYSLGAVDYISTPVVPQVLRSKVAVFVELFRKTEQVKRQAETLRQRAAQLHQLTAASLAINAALSIEKTLQIVADTGRELVGAHQSVAIAVDQGWAHARAAGSFSSRYGEWIGIDPKAPDVQTWTMISSPNRTARLTESDTAARPSWHPWPGGPAPRGWLAAPLSGRDGRNIGLIWLSDRHVGDFTADDEALLTQLAQMTSIAIENTLFSQEREANRIKDEFLSTLSHELRTPLNAILGWTQLLRIESLDGDVGHALEVIERNARAQTKLIEDLLDVSRINTGKFRLNCQPLRLGPVAAAALDAVRPAADARGIAIEFLQGAREDQISGDADRLQQVVWNLLSNAVKFTPTGGRVSVRLERVPDGQQITVADTGAGIRPQFLPYVFDRFRQADSSSTRSHGGLGIGLTIVRHIVELHGGKVSAESPGEGLGATFRVVLPALARDSALVAGEFPKDASDRPTHEIELPGLHVLVVDDQADTRELVAELLTRAEAHVTSAATAEEALELLSSLRPDVLVSDIAMPEQDGYVLIERVRNLSPQQGGNTPAIAITAYAREDDRRRALAAGFQYHLAKPIEPHELIFTLSRIAAMSARHELNKITPEIPAKT